MKRKKKSNHIVKVERGIFFNLKTKNESLNPVNNKSFFLLLRQTLSIDVSFKIGILCGIKTTMLLCGVWRKLMELFL
ncbi:CLUMA_CG019873, isoform A [Clunio marinus]|uniref:CLUMA_CG019873, isoform A n=1 Tax=Clunio marinus TaxID=568069 RepID=A0A1J1J3M6_9DIPT|nr:CLUMA_CG019873, isoform A [Clunio marinus]